MLSEAMSGISEAMSESTTYIFVISLLTYQCEGKWQAPFMFEYHSFVSCIYRSAMNRRVQHKSSNSFCENQLAP